MNGLEGSVELLIECTTVDKENLDNVWVTMGTEGLRMLMCELAGW